MKNRKKNRMSGFDYSSDNLYFVTICVNNMLCCLGEVVEESKDVDENANYVWTGRDLSVHTTDLSVPGENNFNPSKSNRIMRLSPNGIIVQNRLLWLEKQYPYVIIDNFIVMPNHVHAIIEIDSLLTLDKEIKIKSLSSLIGAFKTTSSKFIHETGFLDFSWKRSFYDHIIRSQNSYLNISNYINSNPENWEKDALFSKA